MSESLKDRIKAFEAEMQKQKDAHASSVNSNSSRLPLAILFVKNDEMQDHSIAKDWFNGTHSALENSNQKIKSKNVFLNSICYVLSEISDADEFTDVIVIDNATMKENGALLAKTVNKFTDLIYITKTQQIDLFDRLSQMLEEHESVINFAEMLDERLWQCYDFVREELTSKDFDYKSMQALTDSFEQFKSKDNELIANCLKLINEMRM
jgi:hypothetical protein